MNSIIPLIVPDLPVSCMPWWMRDRNQSGHSEDALGKSLSVGNHFDP